MRNVISRWAASGAIAGCPPPAAGPSAAPAPPLPSPPPRIPQSSRASAALAAGTGGVRKQKAYQSAVSQHRHSGGVAQSPVMEANQVCPTLVIRWGMNAGGIQCR